jgi:hypothetical protein
VIDVDVARSIVSHTLFFFSRVLFARARFVPAESWCFSCLG